MIILDTHALLWWVDGSNAMSQRARRHVDGSMDKGGIGVSSISCWEIGMLVSRQRLELSIPPEEWIAQCEALPFMTFFPVDNAIALSSTALPGPAPSDPVDRIIIATALARSAAIVTKDARIRAYAVPTVW